MRLFEEIQETPPWYLSLSKKEASLEIEFTQINTSYSGPHEPEV